jgi:bifunctional non-homologous end joining protein LigD
MKVKAGRRTIEITHPDKVLFPDDGFTKADLVSYYEAVAPVMLPHVKERLATMERFPDGIAAHRFYNKNAPKYFPEWIDRKTVPKKGGSVNHVVINDAATLVYLAQQACITPHVSMARVDDLDHPDQLMIDLDPSTDDFSIVRETALNLRELLDDLGLFAVVKTSGSRGLHIVVPLDRSADIDFVRVLARDLAELLALRDPKRVTIETSKKERGDRLFVDWMRNSPAQTAVAPFGVRARAGAPVAMPLDWAEVESPDLDPRAWSIKSAIQRVTDKPDPWRGWRRRARSLTRARSRLDEFRDEVS